ncbi:hypothetical protein LINPERPRIM_LOCUS3899 [Linum perenne]
MFSSTSEGTRTLHGAWTSWLRSSIRRDTWCCRSSSTCHQVTWRDSPEFMERHLVGMKGNLLWRGEG